MDRRLLYALLVLVGACFTPALAQPGAPVRLTTGTLRVGTLLEDIETHTEAAQMDTSMERGPLYRQVQETRRMGWRVLAQTPGTDERRAYTGGSIVLQPVDPEGVPIGEPHRGMGLAVLEGVPIVKTRVQGVWLLDAQRRRLTEEQNQAIEMLVWPAFEIGWNRRTARVGESWTVGEDSLRQMLGVGPSNRLAATFHVRFDSVGTHQGLPAAFLSFRLEAQFGSDNVTMYMVVEGAVMRRPDLGLDVRTEVRSSSNTVGQIRGQTGRFDAEEHFVRETVVRRGGADPIPSRRAVRRSR